MAIQEVACYDSWCTRVIFSNFFFIIVLFIALSDLIVDIFFLKIKKKVIIIYLFLAVLGLHCCEWAFLLQSMGSRA